MIRVLGFSTLDEVLRIPGYSKWHLQLKFKGITGIQLLTSSPIQGGWLKNVAVFDYLMLYVMLMLMLMLMLIQ